MKIKELTDDILSQLSANVNKKDEFIKEKIKDTNWKMIDADASEPYSKIQPKDQTLATINKAVTAFQLAAESNKLTDSFRNQENQEIRSATKRYFEKTIERYYRQHSIIQAYS